MKWAFYASGYREKRGKHTGTKSNAYDVRDIYQTNECAVIYCEYNDDPIGRARDVASQWKPGDTITVEGYSWGCGLWTRKFLWELWKCQPLARVNHLTLVDPVVRTWLFFLRWFAVTDWGTIKFPANIDACQVFFQREDEPNASTLEFEGGITASYSQLEYEHTKIDNAEEVTAMTLKVAERWLS